MVDPIEIVLGEEVVTSEVNGQFRVKKHSFQYIPIIKVLEQLLNQIDIMSQVRNPHQSLDGNMRDFSDGEQFNPGRHPLFSVNHKALQILLYYDDFEVANPLGAKATVHKLGGFYWILGNIHPKYRSSLKMLNLAILCPVKWIKKYSMAKVLKPLMADVALLESENGVQLNIGQSIRSFEGTLSLVLADNLGSNGIRGFMESFSAKRPCRFCMGILDEFQTKFTEEEFTMRSFLFLFLFFFIFLNLHGLLHGNCNT
ncbi:uncharacterized protein LOC124446190 [Xenia sp. Carnegie-2017]|uniref:uncharacterized protein LOC124446190 n=1 Tax=Xenia sp. Carnegie-2017 TaxID=2897299 RepID=UPI001F03D406|nr:uncharacterized protein LOC124446190 [Xenia sp. Carnegie-2017]